MRTKFIEANNGFNWGKFSVGQFESHEWQRCSALEEEHGRSLIRGRGWSGAHVFVMDLQTGEGAMFRPDGRAVADLNKRRIWVCPLFEPFLTWLYAVEGDSRDPKWLDGLPGYVELPDAPAEMYGYRRPGPEPDVM